MEANDPRAVLDALVAASGVSYAALSRMLRRNDAYLQQYVKRGTPRALAEEDRALLAAFFRIDEARLGGPARRAAPAIRRLDVAASAGPGALAEDDRAGGTMIVDPALLASLGLDRAQAALLAARGDSMAPGIEDGDMMLVDERDRRPGRRGGVFVLRWEGALMVKRLTRGAAGMVSVASDNPAYPPFAVAAGGMEIIGRVVWLSRALR